MYPRNVYVVPGPFDLPGGLSYGLESVESEEDHEAALEAGFFDSIPEAIEASKGETPARMSGAFVSLGSPVTYHVTTEDADHEVTISPPVVENWVGDEERPKRGRKPNGGAK